MAANSGQLKADMWRATRSQRNYPWSRPGRAVMPIGFCAMPFDVGQVPV